MSRVDKASIVRAAEEVVRDRGARKLTLDAVAERAGLSKGGLLHHFSNKQALLKAMLEETMAQEDRIADEYTAERPGPERGELPGRIHAQFLLMADEESLPRALIAAVAEDPSLLEPIKAHDARIRQEVCNSTKDPDLAQILVFASLGLLMGRVLGVLDADDPVLDRLRRRLLALATEIE